MVGYLNIVMTYRPGRNSILRKNFKFRFTEFTFHNLVGILLHVPYLHDFPELGSSNQCSDFRSIVYKTTPTITKGIRILLQVVFSFSRNFTPFLEEFSVSIHLAETGVTRIIGNQERIVLKRYDVQCPESSLIQLNAFLPKHLVTAVAQFPTNQFRLDIVQCPKSLTVPIEIIHRLHFFRPLSPLSERMEMTEIGISVEMIVMIRTVQIFDDHSITPNFETIGITEENGIE